MTFVLLHVPLWANDAKKLQHALLLTACTLWWVCTSC